LLVQNERYAQNQMMRESLWGEYWLKLRTSEAVALVRTKLAYLACRIGHLVPICQPCMDIGTPGILETAWNREKQS
jgi:hypothetical protein